MANGSTKPAEHSDDPKATAAAAIAAKKAAAVKPIPSASMDDEDGETPAALKIFSDKPGVFVFIGDPADARRGPLMDIDDGSGEEVEPPLVINRHSFPRKKARRVEDRTLCAKLRGNNHFVELVDGQTVDQALANLPRASREQRTNVSVATLGVPSERPRGKKLTRAEKQNAAFEDEL